MTERSESTPSRSGETDSREAGPRDPESGGAYRQILKSSALIGASSLINVLFGLVRTKGMALMLGPSSFGLLGAFSSIADLARTLSQMGVNASGVRQIAQSASTGDEAKTAATSLTLKRVAFGTAAFGAIVVLALSGTISQFTFGNLDQWSDVALLSIAVFFSVVAGGQTALIQGMRRISDLSQLSIIAASLGTVTSLALVYFLREDGLALSMVTGAILAAITGWWYSRRIALPTVVVPFRESANEAAALFKLGTAFVVGDLLVQGAAYLVRIIILRDSGLVAAGLYQAAWTIGGLYVGFVLQSMATDFYPRLVGCIHDKEAANRVVNQQATVSILLAGPGVVATLTLAPLVVHLLYSAKFDGSVETMRWICFGMALRTISWPLGYIIAAAGRQTMFVVAEIAWTLVNIVLTWIFVGKMGPMGAGFAFFLSYIFHILMLLPMVRHLTGFRWTRPNFLLAVSYVACCSIVVAASYWLTPGYAMAIGIILCLVLSVHSALRLAAISSSKPLPRFVLRLIEHGRRLRHTFDSAKAA